MAEYDNTTRFLQGLASDALLDANNLENKLRATVDVDIEEPQFDADITKPTIEKPVRFTDLFEDINDNSQYATWINTKVEEWIDKYFPAINNGLRTLPEDVLCDILKGNGDGYSLAEKQFKDLWIRTRDRSFEARIAAEKNIRAELSQRGFSLPQGVLAHALIQADSQLADSVAQVNADIAAKEAQVKLDLLNMAAQLSVQYKTSIMGSLADFYRMWLTLPDRGLERAKAKASAYGTLYDAIGAYYNIETRFAELSASLQKTEAELKMDATRLRLLTSDNRDSKNAALAQAIRAYGDVATGAATASGSLVAQIESI